MTPARLAECLDLLRWSQRGLAAAIGYDDRLIRRWIAGRRPIPVHVAAWLERAAGWHAENPPPR
jgi:plasmid maintenance system antidote protein VapI